MWDATKPCPQNRTCRRRSILHECILRTSSATNQAVAVVALQGQRRGEGRARGLTGCWRRRGAQLAEVSNKEMMKLEDALWPHLDVAAMLEVVGRDLRHSPEATRLQALAWINTLLIHSRDKVCRHLPHFVSD